MDINPVSATAYSLFVVGVSALVGAQRFLKNGEINFKISLYFAIPSLLGVFVSRKWILPNLSESLQLFHFFSIQKDTFILVFFAIVMLIAALSMLFSWKLNFRNNNVIENNFFLIALDGIAVGLITGFVGAGGVSNYTSFITSYKYKYERINRNIFINNCYQVMFGLYSRIE